MAELGSTNIYGDLDVKNNKIKQVSQINNVTETELNHLGGVTSSIQTQLNSKQATLGYTAANKAGDTFTGNVAVSNTSPTLTVKNTSGTDAAIVLDRNINANWMLLNSNGNLSFKSDYTTSKGDYYDALVLNYNSGNATFKGNVTAPTIIGSLTGNANTATKIKTARTISLSGDVTGSVSFDGSANASITATVADDSHNHIISNIDGLQTALDGKVSNARVLTDVPASAKFTDTNTTYAEITTAEIDTGTATTLRTITARRIKYILDKAQAMVDALSGTITTALAGKVDNSQVLTDVPADAKFTDTVYTHPSTAGNKHIPTGGASGQVLKYSASGTAVWGADDDTITSINGKTGAIEKSDITALGIPAQDTVYTHPTTHPYSMITGAPTSLPASGGHALSATHLLGDDTRSINSAPSVYMNGGARYVSRAGWQTEFKTRTAINSPPLSGTYVYLQTHTPWSDPSGGYPIQVVYGNGTPCWRVGVSTSAWSAWQSVNDDGNASTVNGFTVGTDVPANAKFTDTVYTHPSTAGNKHIPTGGASGQVLKYSASGTAVWGAESVTPVVNNLTSTSTTSALSANQGKALAEQISTKKRTARFVVGTSTAGWTSADCDYLCDGTADQVEINAAITALPATGGEIVILDGTYNITAKIDVNKNNVSIRGNGNATILKRMFNSTSAEGIITLTDRSYCKIANLQVDGNKTSYTNSNNYGIALASSSDNTITGNTCNNSYNFGICLITSSDNTVTGNTCNNNYCGIRLDDSSNNTTTGNTCNSNSFGIDLDKSGINTITGNTCNNNDNTGIYLGYSSNNTVTGNTCYNSDNYGIYLDSSSNSTVTGNTCNSNNYGIALASSSDNTVTGNTCNSNTTIGIALHSSSNNTVTSNACIRGTGLSTDYAVSQHTIQLMGTGNSYNLISNNNCMGKAVTNEGGTGNTLVNNKWNDYGDVYDATITTTWTGSSAPFTQNVIVSGITSADSPVITPIYSATNATAILQKEAWNMISKIETGTNNITVICFEDKPITAIPIQIKGV